MILIDTVVLSELRKRRPSAKVVTWMRSQPDSEVFISVDSIGEIERGVTKAQDPAFADGETCRLDWATTGPIC